MSYNSVYHNIVQVAAGGFVVYYNEVYMGSWHYIVESHESGRVYHYAAIG